MVREFLIDEIGAFKYKIQSDFSGEFRGLNLNISSFEYQMSKVFFPKVFYFDKHRDRELLPNYNTSFSNIITELNWRFKREFLKEVNSDKRNDVLGVYESIHEKINGVDSHEMKLIQPAIDRLEKDFGIDTCADIKMFLFNVYQPYSNAFLGKISSCNQGVPAFEMGSGISMMLALSLAMSFAEESKNTMIVLIDEPELHLHADLQKNLLNFLKQKVFQTVISTHSHIFLDKEQPNNNYILEDLDNPEIMAMPTTKIDLADLQFRLLGNSIDDLYIPESILVVEGLNDKKVLQKCLVLLNFDNINIQIVPAGGEDKIPDKLDRYSEVLNEILKKDKWYSNALNKVVKIIIDGDVTEGRVNNMAIEYSLDKDKQLYHINPTNQYCLEYLLPESLVKAGVNDTVLSDGTFLRDKNYAELIRIVLDDDKLRDKNMCQQVENRVSKTRLNDYVVENLTATILNAPECNNLRILVEWTAVKIS